MILYYKELGSNTPFSQLKLGNPKDIYGNIISGCFDINLPATLDTTKKYEIQYVAYSGSKIVNRQQGSMQFSNGVMQVDVTPLNYGGDGFTLFSGSSVNFIDQFTPTGTKTSAQLKVRKVGTTIWETIALSSTAAHFSWDYGTRTGDYEFQLDAFDGTNTTPSKSIIGKLRLGAQPQVLNYIPKTFTQNKITFAGQPAGSNKITVKYGTAANQLNKTAVLTIGADGKAILDASELAELNLLGSTTVYYTYETTDAAGKVLNRAEGYINVGLGAGSGQHTNKLNDSWIDFQPAQNDGVKMEVFYRKRQVDAQGNFVSDLVNTDISSDEYWGDTAQFQKVTLTPQAGVYRWNLNSLVPQTGFENYEYFYQLYDKNGKAIAFVPGKVNIDSKGNGSIQQNKWSINGSGSQQSQIIKTQSYNAFGEVISETDGNGNVTNLSYNALGKLIEKKSPKVDVRKADGSVIQATPTIEYGYDLTGRLISIKDANGNMNKQSYLNGHNLNTGDWLLANETHADGGVIQNDYDAFGNLKSQINVLGAKTSYEYDIDGNIIKQTRAARTAGSAGANAITTSGVQTALVDTFAYDEMGNRIKATNALNNTTMTGYDSLGRVIQTQTAEGAITKIAYVYDTAINNINGSKGGIKRTETDALGKTLIDETDYFGRVVKHTDKGGRVFNYTYNAGGWLTKQTSSQGQNIEYSYYTSGYIKDIRDVALNLLTAYRYDDNGNRIEERYQELNAKVREPRIFQNAQIGYDALNRVISVQDQSFNIHYDYDANNNIIHMLSNYKDAVNAAPKIQDFWYSYDNMNRITTSMGVFNTTTKKVEKGNTGVILTYDKAGQRTSADYGKDALDSTKAHKETYSYTTDGYLESVKNANYDAAGKLGAEFTLAVRHNDALGRVVKYETYNENSNSIYQTATSVYNKDNLLTSQTKTGGSGAGTTVYSYLGDKSTLDKTVMTPTSGTVQTTQYSYEWWDTAKQKSIKSTAGSLVGETTFSYDLNGHINGFVDNKNAQNKRSATYINNSSGMVLQRNELINDSMNRYRNFYYANGQRIGDVSNDGPSREDYVQSLQNSQASPTQAKDFKPVSSADFDQNYEPINSQYPSSAPGSYIVSNGDTLQSIALAIWGDASMWYMLADVNALSPSDKLTAGQILTIPNKVTNIHNTSQTYRPYSAGEAIGDTQPTLPAPPPPKSKKKCGGIAQIVMIVVAVVATIYTAGAASGLIAGMSGALGFGTAMGAGVSAMVGGLGAAGVAGAAIGAAVGSAASQLVGKAMGVVDDFSWSQVGISALTAGATAGVGVGISKLGVISQSAWLQTASKAVTLAEGAPSWSWVAAGAFNGVVGYGSNYIANQAFGNNQHFSWASIGSSVAGSIAASGIGRYGTRLEQYMPDRYVNLGSPYAYSLAGANAAAVIEDKWFGGSRPDYVNVSMAAIANTVGRQFGNNSADNTQAVPVTQYKSIDEGIYFEATEYNSEQMMTGQLHLEISKAPDEKITQYSDDSDLYLVEYGDGSKRVEGKLPTMRVQADSTVSIKNALAGANSSIIANRVKALSNWNTETGNMMFQYNWSVPTVNTGYARLDKYVLQPVSNIFNTVANAGWNALKLVGNAGVIVGNAPVAGLSALTGNYDESQRQFDAILWSNPATAFTIGSPRLISNYLSEARTINSATRTFGRMANQAGSVDPRLVNDIPVGISNTQIKKPVLDMISRREYLNKKFGRTGDLNLDIAVRARQEIAFNFYKLQGFNEIDIPSHLAGIDFTKSVEVITLSKGSKLFQFQVSGAPQGNYYTINQDILPTQLGINPNGFNRNLKIVEVKNQNVYIANQKVNVLRSQALGVIDFWSIKGENYQSIGGGTQLFTSEKDKLTIQLQ
nr:polymorphic toxin type 46 domain-containing protein [Acinetobacter sp. Marseille-Q1620]